MKSTSNLNEPPLTPAKSARNLGVMIDDQLIFNVHGAAAPRSRRFALNSIRKIRPFLPEHEAQFLVQALVISGTDYCDSLLAGTHPRTHTKTPAALPVFKKRQKTPKTLFWSKTKNTVVGHHNVP